MLQLIKWRPGRLDPRSSAAGVILIALTMAASVLVYQNPARSELEQNLTDGAAWVRSTGAGLITLLDGSEGDVVASLEVALAEDDLLVATWASDAIVVNRTDQTIFRLDGTSWEKTAPLALDVDIDALLTAGKAAWMVRPGFASRIDLDTFEITSSIAVGAPYGSGLVASDGALYYGSSAQDEPAQRIELVNGEGVVTTLDGLDGAVTFAQLDQGVVGVDLDDGRVWSATSGVICDDLQLSTGDVVAAGANDRLIVVSSEGAVSFWNPFDSGCPVSSAVLDIGPGIYGPPVVADGWAVIPNLENGELSIVSNGGPPLIAKPQTVVPTNGFELIVENNSVWFNDPSSNIAGLVRADGRTFVAEKYQEGTDDGILVPPTADEKPEVLGALQERDTTTTTDGSTTSTVEATESAPTSGPTTTTTNPTTSTPADGSEPATTATSQPSTTEDPDPSASTSEPDQTTTTSSPTDASPTTTTPPTTASPTTASPTTASPTSVAPTTASPNSPGPDTPDPQIAISRQDVSPTVGVETRYEASSNDFAPVVWTWSVQTDDGDRSGSDNRFFYTFGAAGSHTVSVRACDGANVCADASLSVTVVAGVEETPLSASFNGKTTVEVGEQATFQSTSQGSPDRLSWTFEGGTPDSGTGSSASTSWSEPGDYRVSLQATRDGISDTALQFVTVTSPRPPASFGLTCSPSRLNVGQTSNCSLNESASDFTDLDLTASPSATVRNLGQGQFTVTASQADTYTATLRGRNATDGADRFATATITFEQVTVVDPPVVRIDGAATAKVGETIQLVGTTVSGQVDNWSWDSGGGSPGSSTQQTQLFSWSSPGSYTVRLTGSGPDGSRSDTHTVTVADVPDDPPTVAVAATKTSVEPGESVTLSGQATSGVVNSWSWDTNGGSPASSSQQSFTVSWATAGTKTVTLAGTGPSGTGSTTINIVVATAQPPKDIVLQSSLPEARDFTLIVSTSQCTVVTWQISSAGVGPYTQSPCETRHVMSPRTNVTLEPNTSYRVDATFTWPDGSTTDQSWTVTTLTDDTPPTLEASVSVAQGGSTLTMTSNECTTVEGWISSTDGGSLGIPDHTDFFSYTTCATSHSFSFVREPGRPYRFNATFTSVSGQTVSRNGDF